MDTVMEPLLFELIDWLIQRQRTHEEVMYAYRTPRSRFLVWEEANSRGLVTTEVVDRRCLVKPTSLGLILAELQREHRRQGGSPRSNERISNSTCLCPQ